MKHSQSVEWTDWQWQLRHRLRTEGDFCPVIELTCQERTALRCENIGLPTAVTPYYASLCDPKDPSCPIRRQAIPLPEEMISYSFENIDSLAEETQSPIPFLVHRYPDRVLIMATHLCATYCRHCTRRRRVGLENVTIADEDLARIRDYLETHKIRDVLISGGDPLCLSDARLANILNVIDSVPHVEILRIGTRTPVTNPFRITQDLVDILRRHRSLWISTHFNHPKEITEEAKQACSLLIDHGIPVLNQTVLLAGINDSTKIQQELVRQLVRMKVYPYYLYQCDLVSGIEHFRTPPQVGINIIKELQGRTTGFAVPRFVIDAPGGGGKIPLEPQRIIKETPTELILQNYEGKCFRYPTKRLPAVCTGCM
ncbi:MAG: KamA family radical SAM protein [Limnochordia bacterium]|nr:KamA family radical SAM protein [Limnochordia bacterium]MDD2630744.1 KamA family radical SAM protein [Limnochordia bacterium]